MKTETIALIEAILEKCVRGALIRTRSNKTSRPFHEALLTKEMVNASSFERSFSTSFGQGPVEEISRIVAIDAGFTVTRQRQTLVNVFKGAIDEIERISSGLRSGELKPNWEREIANILAFQKGDTVVRRVLSDLHLEKDGKEIFISIKTVKPNLDQTEKAKKDLLLLKAHDPNFETYFGLYYNPGGPRKADYNWSLPSKIFDMRHDPVVLIGDEYWDKLGGPDTYTKLLEIFARVGEKTRNEILSL
ncbi:TdeIII family type II restriction endonuclease [Algoriphagus sp. H41]|uniref:type II site-specific deoxyribonuclease n=2 Tax=Algoriphagus oliviformis TaxID=2811231 RepID=A0ABS3C0Z5_9BACT|nr:TdeIII family type II restriction endonuclease [Algoriphagus oliviformis]